MAVSILRMVCVVTITLYIGFFIVFGNVKCAERTQDDLFDLVVAGSHMASKSCASKGGRVDVLRSVLQSKLVPYDAHATSS